MSNSKVVLIGLDCAPAPLVFDHFLDRLPNIKQLVENGIFGTLWSCDPPITIPAWMVMMTGKSPGRLGLYGFRHRDGNSYTEITLPTSDSVREPKVWDIIAREGKKSCIIGVPPSYPPRPINGWLVSCFMTPDTSRPYTYPASLKQEIEQIVGDYIVDVSFRTEDRDAILEELYRMTEKRFQVIQYLLTHKSWDFFMCHEIGLDRLQHTFWKFFDKGHHLYEPENQYETVIQDYYVYLDSLIGRLLSELDASATVVIASDHGAKRMKGTFCVNQWLSQEGYLSIIQNPERPITLEKAQVDWGSTKAWAWGGYYSRIFLNMKGREPVGTVDPEDYEKVRDELAAKLREIRGPQGERWETQVYRPEELFEQCHGDHADLMVYFDDLYWRAGGTVGHPTTYLLENDTGPDDAVHSKEGMYIIRHPKLKAKGRRNAFIEDMAPTILELMGVDIPDDMLGQSIIKV